MSHEETQGAIFFGGALMFFLWRNYENKRVQSVRNLQAFLKGWAEHMDKKSADSNGGKAE